MNLGLTIEEKHICNTLKSLETMKVSNDKYNSSIKQDIITSIKKNLIALGLDKDFSDPSNSDDIDKEASNSSDFNFFCTAYATALFNGYLQSLNNDTTVDGNSREFGFSELNSIFKSAFITNGGSILNDSDTDSLIESGFVVKLRDCSAKEYFDNKHYKDDLLILNELLSADVDDGYNKEIKKAIIKNGNIKNSIDLYLDDIISVYNILFEDSFGLNHYAGVLLNSKSFYTVKDSNCNGTVITTCSANIGILANRLYSKVSNKIKISDKRQFDYDEIFNNEKIIYFPKKILEYALGRQSTLNTTSDVYNYCKDSILWESYRENYVRDNLKEILVRGVYKALEKILLRNKIINADFVSQEFTVYLSKKELSYSDFVSKYINDPEIFDKVRVYLARLVNSTKCAYLLTRYNCLGDSILDIYIRFTCESIDSDSFKSNSTSINLFKNLIASNDNETFDSPIDLASERKQQSGKEISVGIFECQYNVNPILSAAEPLFGYKVHRKNQISGKEANWKRILIGESLSGKELYSTSGGDIYFQGSFVHNIFAGSRSGKGVMTMNILASAIAEGKPIFYLDGKPDMASMFYSLVGDDMFIVNSGNYQPKFDISGAFDENSGSAMRWYRSGKAYFDENPSIAALFYNNIGYNNNDFGYYVYFRAFMFCLGICSARVALGGLADKNPEYKELYEKLNGSKGIIIVADETSVMTDPLKNYFSMKTSPIPVAGSRLPSSEEILNEKEKLEGEINVLRMKADEAKSASARGDAENKIRLKEKELESLIDEQSIYARTLLGKLTDSFETLKKNRNAGWTSTEYPQSDIFALGQDIPDKSLGSGDIGETTDPATFFPKVASKGGGILAAYQFCDVLRSFLDVFGSQDWFVGRNNKHKNYGFKDSTDDGRKATKVCEDQGNWDYLGSHKTDEVAGRVKGASSKHVFFKPYLVLNGHHENNPPKADSEDKKFQYVQQCALRVDAEDSSSSDQGIPARPGLWEQVRLKHIKEGCQGVDADGNPIYDVLDEGIGFNGLVKDTLLTTEEGKQYANGDITEYMLTGLKKSGTIANIAANALGYSCWQELIFDFSPRGLCVFSIKDVERAILDSNWATNENILPLYAEFGLLGNNNSNKESEGDREEPDFSQLFNEEQPQQNVTTSNFSQQEQPTTAPTQQSHEEFYGSGAMNQLANEAGYNDDIESDFEDLEEGYDEEPISDYDDDNEEEINNSSEIESRDGSWTDEERYSVAVTMVRNCLETCTMLLRSTNASIPDLWSKQDFVDKLVFLICRKMKEMGY
jgi:hypothetical protein